MDFLLDTSTFSCKKVKKRHYYALLYQVYFYQLFFVRKQ